MLWQYSEARAGISKAFFRTSRSHNPILLRTMIFSPELALLPLIKAPMVQSRFAPSELPDVYIWPYIASQTSYNTWYSSLIPPFIQSISELGFNINPDPNCGDLIGLSNIARTVDGETSTRQHAGVAYLDLTTGRDNISVLVGAHATKLLFSDGSGDLIVTAVEFSLGGVKYIVKANLEVVLSAGKSVTGDAFLWTSYVRNFNQGAYQTPQLLELSGIGQKSLLSEHGIETLVELPVGENLQDHLMVSLNFGLTSEAQGED